MSAEEVEMKFKRPDSYVVSVRLNQDESRTITAEARRRGEKLSTFMKKAAMKAACGAEQDRPVILGGGGQAHVLVQITGVGMARSSDGSHGSLERIESHWG